MAYLQKGQSEFNFDDYDVTPFSGGYDQAAIYGRPKPPSQETCYPISDQGAEDGRSRHGYSHHGADSTPYLPSRMDQCRPSSGYEGPAQRPDYGESRPGYGSGGGYGRPDPKPAWESSYESGYGRPKPSEFEQQGYEESYERPSYGRPKPSGYEESYGRPSFDQGYGGPQPPPFEQSFEKPSFEQSYGRPKPSGIGESYGGAEYEGAAFQERPPSCEGYGYEASDSYGSAYKKPGYEGYQQEPSSYEEGYGRNSGQRKDTWEETPAVAHLSLGSEGQHDLHGHKHHRHHRHHDYE